MKITPLKFLMTLIIAFFVISLITFVYVKSVISEGMPSISQLENPKLNLATQIYSSDGVLIDNFYIERRVDLPYDSIPKYFIKALISTEDKNFYKHWGVYVGRIFQAAIKNLFAGYAKEGASTITMQLARNLYLTKETSLSRKIREAFTAIQIERNYTKEQILQLYSNTVYFGRGAYGIGVASQVFFGKNPLELTLSECASLVALLKSPTGYDPFINPEKATQRRDLILTMMLDQNAITPAEYLAAEKEPLISLDKNQMARLAKARKSIAPHFVEMIRQELNDDERLANYDLYRDGLNITTTLNYRIQQYANEVVEEHFKDLQAMFDKNWSWSKNNKILQSIIDKAIKTNPSYRSAKSNEKDAIYNKLKNSKNFIDSVKNAATTIQLGLVMIDPKTGDIVAMIGASPKFVKENPSAKYSLNHVTQIRRQPGSSFKPFVYTAALMHGLTPLSMIECGPYSYTLPSGEVWSPAGFGSCSPGESRSLYSALSSSINTVAARLITQVTNPDEVISIAKKMGIKSPLVAYPALALGAGGDVSPLEMTSAFGTFPTRGINTQTRFLRDVTDHYGNTIIQTNRRPIQTTGIISDTIAQEMIYMMKGVIDNGTASIIKQYFAGVEAAGKTGTTNDAADAWFIGYTPELVCGIWVGFDDKRITFDFLGSYGYGGRVAAPIWGKLMAKIYADPLLPYKQRSFGLNLNFAPSDTNQPAIDNTKQLPQNKPAEPNPKKEHPASALPPLPKKNKNFSN
jgi:penicillin-binding protein 1A